MSKNSKITLNVGTNLALDFTWYDFNMDQFQLTSFGAVDQLNQHLDQFSNQPSHKKEFLIFSSMKMLLRFSSKLIVGMKRDVDIIFFSTRCPNWTQACSHILGYIPGPIGSLFAIAPTHILEWQFCHPFMRLGNIGLDCLLWALDKG